MKVCGLGQCSLDYIALVKRYPPEDSKEEASSLTIQGGGPVATALVTLSRLGAKTEFIGVVSNDPAGAEIKKGLLGEGVGLKGLKTVGRGSSQTAFIVVNPASASRTIFWKRPAAATLRARDVKESLIKTSDLLLIDGLMPEASLRAAFIARKNGIPVVLDAGRVRPGMMELVRASDYVVASEDFARGLSLAPEEALKAIVSLGPRIATVTLGKAGSVTMCGGEAFCQKAFRVAVVDTTGAGDVFHGAYVYGLLKGWDMRRTVEFASAAAALKCGKIGGRAGIAPLSRTLAFIRKSRRAYPRPGLKDKP